MCVHRTEDGLCKLHSTDGITSYCVDCPCNDEVLTNADRIRTMSDEELAKWLEYEGGGACAEVCGWLEWLRKPAEED